MDVTAWNAGSMFIKKIYEIFLGTIMWITKLSKLKAFILLGYLKNTDATILVYKHRPERTGFNVYAENTHQQLTLLALLLIPCLYPTPPSISYSSLLLYSKNTIHRQTTSVKLYVWTFIMTTNYYWCHHPNIQI